MPKCPLCGSVKTKRSIFGGYRYQGTPFYLTRCLGCGFLYVDPLPDKDVMKKMYDDADYFKKYWVRNSRILGYYEGKDAARDNAVKTLDVIKKYKNTGSMIDIGCAGGHFLGAAKEMGYKCTGLEPNAAMAAYAKNTYGIDVINKDFCEASLTLPKFDIVYMGDVLEHMSGVDNIFGCVKNVMTKTSLFVIEGPMTFNRSLYNMFLALNMVFKKDRMSDNPPYHILEFAANTMRRAIEDNGFRLLYFRITEDSPRFVEGFDGNSLKEKAGRLVKYVSAEVSCSPVGHALSLGDRVFLIAAVR